VTELDGRVERRRVAAGTKSDRVALVLVLDDGAAPVLRRRGGPAFGDDPDLAALEGAHVRVTGTRTATAVLADRWERIERP
jgi:hypothetical protein